MMSGIPPCFGGETEAWSSGSEGYGPREEALWAKGMASGGLGLLLGDAESLLQALPSWSRKTCLLPPPGAQSAVCLSSA